MQAGRTFTENHGNENVATLKMVKFNINNTRGSNFIGVKLTTILLTKLSLVDLQQKIRYGII
jgi:hypothetical protein